MAIQKYADNSFIQSLKHKLVEMFKASYEKLQFKDFDKKLLAILQQRNDKNAKAFVNIITGSENIITGTVKMATSGGIDLADITKGAGELVGGIISIIGNNQGYQREKEFFVNLRNAIQVIELLAQYAMIDEDIKSKKFDREEEMWKFFGFIVDKVAMRFADKIAIRLYYRHEELISKIYQPEIEALANFFKDAIYNSIFQTGNRSGTPLNRALRAAFPEESDDSMWKSLKALELNRFNSKTDKPVKLCTIKEALYQADCLIISDGKVTIYERIKDQKLSSHELPYLVVSNSEFQEETLCLPMSQKINRANSKNEEWDLNLQSDFGLQIAAKNKEESKQARAQRLIALRSDLIVFSQMVASEKFEEPSSSSSGNALSNYAKNNYQDEFGNSSGSKDSKKGLSSYTQIANTLNQAQADDSDQKGKTKIIEDRKDSKMPESAERYDDEYSIVTDSNISAQININNAVIAKDVVMPANALSQDKMLELIKRQQDLQGSGKKKTKMTVLSRVTASVPPSINDVKIAPLVFLGVDDSLLAKAKSMEKEAKEFFTTATKNITCYEMREAAQALAEAKVRYLELKTYDEKNSNTMLGEIEKCQKEVKDYFAQHANTTSANSSSASNTH